MKKAEITFSTIVIAIFVVVGGVLAFVLLGAFKVGPDFYYGVCEGDIDATTYYDSSGQVIGYASPVCTVYDDRLKGFCESAFSTVEVGGEEKTVCRYLGEDEEIKIDQDGESKTVQTWLAEDENSISRCILQLGCQELSLETAPLCYEVPRCSPESYLKVALLRIKPYK